MVNYNNLWSSSVRRAESIDMLRLIGGLQPPGILPGRPCSPVRPDLPIRPEPSSQPDLTTGGAGNLFGSVGGPLLYRPHLTLLRPPQEGE